MPQEAALSSDETQVITNVSRSFAKRMHWSPQWEPEDIHQELCLEETDRLEEAAKRVERGHGKVSWVSP